MRHLTGTVGNFVENSRVRSRTGIRGIPRALVPIAIFLAATSANAERGLSLSVGGGITADPEAALIVIEAPFGITNGVSIGPHLQLVIDDGQLITAATGMLRFTGGGIGPFRTFLQAGMGIAHPSGSRIPDESEESEFLMTLGIGAELPVGGGFSLRTSAMANIVPQGAPNDEFFFSWEALALRYRF